MLKRSKEREKYLLSRPIIKLHDILDINETKYKIKLEMTVLGSFSSVRLSSLISYRSIPIFIAEFVRKSIFLFDF